MKTTGCVDAFTPSAKARGSLAFVNVHTDLHHRGGFETSITITSESSGNIDASTVSTNAKHDVAFIDVHTPNSILVQSISLVATTTIATNGVLAAAILAHVGKIQTFIDVQEIYKSWTFGAKLIIS